MAEMTAEHFNQDEPLRVYNFYLEIAGQTSLRMHVEQVRMPTFGVAVLRERFFNEDIKVAGAAVVGENQIVARDTVSNSCYNELISWSKDVHNPGSGAIGYAKDYKKQGFLILADPKGIEVKKITVKGIWPQQISGSELTYNTEAGDVKIQVVFQVDKYIFS